MRALLAYYADAVMAAAAARGAGCARGCSGRGDCLNGTCLCEIRYAGDECSGPNMPYHVGIGGVFLAVSLVCLVQLVTCVVYEYRRMKAPNVWRACKVTTQKMLYLLALLASLIRGAYFVSPSAFEEGWASSLLSAYYPLLMSGSSLIVCFWAEVFHLRDVRWERPRFLSKSFLGFATFNAISYSLLLAEVLVANYADTSGEKKSLYQHIFNGCYAVLLFIVVIFFLIYGVEVYFKVRGGFLSETRVCSIQSASVQPRDDDQADVRDTLVTKLGVRRDLSRADGDGALARDAVDRSQLQQSRLGLLSQACMLTIIVCFLALETVSELWKTKVPVNSRNWHDLVFRLAEIGVALWFPCVLWNCMAPERLWLLNPRRLLSRQLDEARLADLVRPQEQNADSGETASLVGSVTSVRECWICYDGESTEPLMQPCRCKGDVSSVHHSCLRRWLVESAANPDGLKCKVCGSAYAVTSTTQVDWTRGFTATHWLRTVCVVVMLACVCAGALVAVKLSERTVVHVLSVGGAALVLCVGCKILSINMASAWQRAKMSSLSIAEQNEQPSTSQQQDKRDRLATISSQITVEIASRQVLDQVLRGDK